MKIDIYSFYVKNNKKNTSSSLGASMIDSSCERKSYHNFYDKKPIEDGRILRLLETGHIQEERLINDLRNIGIEITRCQERLADKDMPNFVAKPDGVANIDGEPYILEIKTHNDKSFKDLLKKGMKLSKTSHFDQMQINMGFSEIKQGLYLALNKNDESIHYEYVLFDELYFYYLRDLAKRILNQENTNKASDNKDFFMCKMCQYRDICHA